ALAAALLPLARLHPAEGDPTGPRLEHPLRRNLPDHAARHAAHVRSRRPPARHARRLSRRRLGVSRASAEGPHLQRDGERRSRRPPAREGAPMSRAARAVAVTGASGFLGRALCAHLAARGVETRPLVRDPAAFSLTGASRAARCDLPDVLDESALAGAAAVVHCAYA